MLDRFSRREPCDGRVRVHAREYARDLPRLAGAATLPERIFCNIPRSHNEHFRRRRRAPAGKFCRHRCASPPPKRHGGDRCAAVDARCGHSTQRDRTLRTSRWRGNEAGAHMSGMACRGRSSMFQPPCGPSSPRPVSRPIAQACRRRRHDQRGSVQCRHNGRMAHREIVLSESAFLAAARRARTRSRAQTIQVPSERKRLLP